MRFLFVILLLLVSLPAWRVSAQPDKVADVAQATTLIFLPQEQEIELALRRRSGTPAPRCHGLRLWERTGTKRFAAARMGSPAWLIVTAIKQRTMI